LEQADSQILCLYWISFLSEAVVIVRGQMSHQADNIFAGTQVVTLMDVRGTNNSLVHPKGAVGVVTRTPTGAEAFPGAVSGWVRGFSGEQLDVLKHFKDRLPGAEAAMAEFDLEQLIIYRCVVGSRAYGLETEDSDVDRRGFIWLRRCCSGRSAARRNSSRTIQSKLVIGSCRNF
jgi:hypothetical protein